MKNKKRNRFLLLLILLLGITIGYAALATTLKINGSATITKNTWEIYWNNVQVTPGSVDASTNIPSIGQDTNDPVNTKVTWSTTLNLPGDFYEFTVDAVNNGSIDAMITGITPTVTPALEDYIKYTVTYDDGVAIAENHILPKKTGNTATVQKYKVRIEFLDTITPEQMNAIPEGGLSYTFSYEVTYGQATDDAIIKPPFVLGDYFTLVPDATTYTILGTDTGYTQYNSSTHQNEYVDQTINPSELTLWRVIDIHDDGTVDAISEYTSSTSVYLRGTTSYANSIGILQDIASQYTKSGYTVGTRMFGYNGQTLRIPDTSSFTSAVPSYSTPQLSTTGFGSEYSDDGVLGDDLFIKDRDLVGNVYSSDPSAYSTSGLRAYQIGTTTFVPYWTASRYYAYAYLGKDTYWLSVRTVKNDGYDVASVLGSEMSKCGENFECPLDGPCYSAFACTNSSSSNPVRPIITLKYGVVKNGGSGTKSDPFTFE